MVNLIESIGARMVLLGQKEYVAAIKEASAATKTLATAGQEVTAASAEMQAATDKVTAALVAQKDAARNAMAAQRELEAAERSLLRAEAEEAAASDKTTQATLAKATARRDAALSAKVAADDQVAASGRDAAAARADAAAVEAAEAQKAAARDAGMKVMKTAALGVAAAATVVVAASVKMATDFQTQMTRLYTAAGAPKDAVLASAGAVLKIGDEVGVAGDKIAEALYHPISAGLDLATSLNVVEQSAKEAAISGASLDDTTYSLSSVMKAFNQPASQAEQTMAQLNAIVGQGDMRFQDFNASIKNWTPTAAQMGISINSMGAGLAYLTDRGMTAEVASTRLTMGLTMMATPSAQAAKLLESMGVASGDVKGSSDAMTAALQKAHVTQNQLATDLQQPDGLYVALNHLETALKKAGVTGTEADSVISKIFGGGRSDKAIADLLANLDGVKQKFEDINKASTTQQFEQNWADAQKNLGFEAQKLGAELQNLGIQIGSYLVPVLTPLVSGISNAAHWMTEHSNVAKGLAIALGVILVFALAAVVVALYNVAAGLMLAEVAGAPLLLVAAAVIAGAVLIGLAAYEIVTHWGAVKGFFLDLWDSIKSGARAAVDGVVGFFAPIVAWFVARWDDVKAGAKAAWDWIVGIVLGVVHGIANFFQPVVDMFRTHADEIKQIAEFIGDFLSWIWGGITAVAKWAWGGISSFLVDSWSGIQKLAEVFWAVISGTFQMVWGVITGIFRIAIDIIWAILQTAWTVIWTNIKVTWDIILGVLRMAWDAIVMVFNLARDIIIGIIAVFLDLVTGHWSRAWTDIKDYGLRIWNDIWGGISKIATDLWNMLKNIFNDMWNGAKTIFTNLWHDLVSVFRDGANMVIDVINGFLNIVNKIAGAIGFSINLHIDHVTWGLEEGGVIPVRMMAEGGTLNDFFTEVGSGFVTNGPRAIVGEGNPNHPEYVIPTDPTHRARALGLFTELSTYLIPGMAPAPYAAGGALPGVPAHADGGIIGDIWGGITSVAGSVASGFNAAVNWVGNAASQGIAKVIEGVWPALPVPADSFAGIVPATLNTWRQKALDFVTGKYNASQASSAMGGAGGPAPAGQVNDWILQALAILGYPTSYAAGIYHQIMTESGGNPGVTQHGYTDVNTLSGNLAQGIMQVIPPTFRANALPGHGNPFNAVDNIIAGSRYAMGRYGPGWFADGSWHSHGYETGGMLPILARADGGPVASGMPYVVGERGPELFVPSTPGTVLTADLTGDIAGGGGQATPSGLAGSGQVIVQAGAITVYEAGDARRTYEATMQGMADAIARR